MTQDGRFLKIDTPTAITDSYAKSLWSVRSNSMHRLLDDLRQWPGADTVFSFGDTYHVTIKNGFDSEQMQRFITDLGHEQVVIDRIGANIEDAFMALS